MCDATLVRMHMHACASADHFSGVCAHPSSTTQLPPSVVGVARACDWSYDRCLALPPPPTYLTNELRAIYHDIARDHFHSDLMGQTPELRG